MEFNNKSFLIIGLIILAFVAMYFSYKDIALAIASGLVGYLSKDAMPFDQLTQPVDPVVSDVVPVVSENDPIVSGSNSVDEVSNIDEDTA